jgi:beta-glucosidase
MIAHGMGDLQTVSAMALKRWNWNGYGGEGLTTLKKSLNENKVSIEQIDNAVRLILNAKYDLGLFQDPYKYCDVKKSWKWNFTTANRLEARKIASQSLVLLKMKKSKYCL